ncbi:hypothetical protein [Hyphomicrobium sp.]|uniref:hypothetical protein n=1 Tax=Hyphomicrobium sp. TaxID=82 RepID=UPI003F7228C4
MPTDLECGDTPALLANLEEHTVEHVQAGVRLHERRPHERRPHEHWVSTRMSAEPAPDAPEFPPEIEGETSPARTALSAQARASMGTHWLSENMSADPAPGPWTLPAEPPAPEVNPLARIESIEDKLSAAEAAPAIPRNTAASHVLYEPPPFLGDAHETIETPNLPVLVPTRAPEQQPVSPPKLGWSMAAAAAGLALFAGGIAHTRLTAIENAACDGAPCGTTAPMMFGQIARASLASSTSQTTSAAPGLTIASAPSSVGTPPEPAFDPLETITVRDLPPDVKLTAGEKISDTDWTIAPSELANVGFVVPHDHTEPVRAEVEFKSREGVVMARFGLGIVNEPPPVEAPVLNETAVPNESLKERAVSKESTETAVSKESTGTAVSKESTGTAVSKEIVATCLGQPCGSLEPAMYAIIANHALQPEDRLHPGIVLVADGDAAAQAPEPAVEQPESVTVSGLPPDVELSAGERISETGWKIAADELADVGVVIPHDQIEPVRAEIEFKSDEGIVMARLGLDIVHAQPPPVAEVATEPAKPFEANDANDEQTGAQQPLAIRPTPRAKKGRAAAVRQQPAAAAGSRKAAAPAIQPRGLFQFEPPQNSAKPKPAPIPKAEVKKPEKKAQAPVAEKQASAAPVGTEQAPGFRIQSTLDRPN